VAEKRLPFLLDFNHGRSKGGIHGEKKRGGLYMSQKDKARTDWKPYHKGKNQERTCLAEEKKAEEREKELGQASFCYESTHPSQNAREMT